MDEYGLEITESVRLAVFRDECRINKYHDFKIKTYIPYKTLGPLLVFCGVCKEEWRIHPEDEGKDFPKYDRGRLDTV